MFYFTTCGWMMWNWMLSSLAVGATVVLYDGAPLQPTPAILWDMIAAERVTVFGTSAKYLALAEKAGLRPAQTHDLSAAARDPFDRQPARRAQLRLRVPLREGRRASREHQRRHRHHLVLRARQSDRARVSRARCSVAGSAWRSRFSTTHGSRVLGEPGELVCTRAVSEHADRVLERSRRVRNIARHTSITFRAYGGTETGPSSPSTAG